MQGVSRQSRKDISLPAQDQEHVVMVAEWVVLEHSSGRAVMEKRSLRNIKSSEAYPKDPTTVRPVQGSLVSEARLSPWL